MTGGWDLTALINAADARAPRAERHLWLVRLLEWLRHAPTSAPRPGREAATPLPALRLKHLLHVLDSQPALREQVTGTLAAFWREIDIAALLADFGFGSRLSLASELIGRIRARLLPGTPDTPDLAALFPLLFDDEDDVWIDALDPALFERALALAAPPPDLDWRSSALHAITMLGSAVRAAAFAPLLRQRMDPDLLKGEPFRALASAVDSFREAVAAGPTASALTEANLLRGLLDRCLAAADSVHAHLDANGISVDVVYEMDQLRSRVRRIERLVSLVLAPELKSEVRALLVELLTVQRERRGIAPLLAAHYSRLARQVAERSAETGHHYIARGPDEYREMLRRAAGGGAVIAGTTFLKFGIAALGLSAFWAGFFAGVNYAASFVLIMLLHWTVATKQPAMTAPAMAESLPTSGTATDEEIEAFVDRVEQLIRSQAAAVFGNLAACAPLVLLVQWVAIGYSGRPLIGESDAHYVMKSLTLLGPTAFYAAFTGVVLFASSLIAGWAENWFVFHRLDSAIAWNPRIVARLGSARAQRWAAWWRQNISGLAANVSLGLLLGLLPTLATFVGLPIEVRHVTLATGQLAAASVALGWGVLATHTFWWCVAGIAAIGVLNIGVSFWCAFKVALRSRGIRLKERERIHVAIRQRLRERPLAFLLPR